MSIKGNKCWTLRWPSVKMGLRPLRPLEANVHCGSAIRVAEAHCAADIREVESHCAGHAHTIQQSHSDNM